MYKKARIFWLLALILFCLQTGVSSGGEKDTPRGDGFSGIHFRNGRLRVSVETQKFQRVMDEVAQKAGIRIVIDKSADEDVTMDFDYLPLEKGLKKLLRGKNYVFIYRSGEGVDFMQSSDRLTKVLVFPKSGGWTMAGLGEIAEKRSADRAKQTSDMKEMLNPTQERLDEVLQGFSQNGMDLRKQFYDALEKIREMDGFKKIIKLEDDGFQGFSESRTDTLEKIYDALEEIQAMENVIIDFSK